MFSGPKAPSRWHVAVPVDADVKEGNGGDGVDGIDKVEVLLAERRGTTG